MTGGSHGVVVGIEDGYRVSTGAGKLDIEERILLTRTEYSFLEDEYRERRVQSVLVSPFSISTNFVDDKSILSSEKSLPSVVCSKKTIYGLLKL
jgi:hypothetical protein